MGVPLSSQQGRERSQGKKLEEHGDREIVLWKGKHSWLILVGWRVQSLDLCQDTNCNKSADSSCTQSWKNLRLMPPLDERQFWHLTTYKKLLWQLGIHDMAMTNALPPNKKNKQQKTNKQKTPNQTNKKNINLQTKPFKFQIFTIWQLYKYWLSGST